MKSMAASSSTRAFTSPHHPTHFKPIEEGNEEEEFSKGRSSFRTISQRERDYNHHPTPLHAGKNRYKAKRRENNEAAAAVSCNKCRPNTKEKNSVIPLENNGMLKSILSSLAIKKSPGGFSTASREERWKIAVAELTNKLIQASKKRDEAVLEASELKFAMAELEKKLSKLEIYCHGLKSELEFCSNGNNSHYQNHHKYFCVKVGDQERVVEHFLILVSEARSSVRILTRVLIDQLRQMGGRLCDRISLLLQSFDIKVSLTGNPRGLLCYLEALLNRVVFEDFESIGFGKGAPTLILNPKDRCEAKFATFSRLQGLTWEEVLSKGTRHFSEELSKFCDGKMSEIMGMFGWNRAWPEPLLHAFFRASKAVWLVHLLANSVHPGLPIFRVENGVGFDPVYMEDMEGDKVKMLTPKTVRVMVAPGFYVYDSVVKSKVVCSYYNHHHSGSN